MRKFLESLRSDGVRFVDVVRTGPLEAVVPTCPGWTLADLTRHMGEVHRWVVLAVETVERPREDQIDGPHGASHDELANWLRDGLDRLLAVLAAKDPASPTWHPFSAPKVAGVWPRRQAQETMVHRWDAENAVGAVTPLDPPIAADGILEYFELIVPRVVVRDGRAAPRGVLRIECPDVDMVCTVSSGTTVDVELGDGVAASPDATIRANAEDVLLALWKRVSLPGDHPPLTRDWLAFGGN